MCEKDAVDGGIYCERHRGDPNTARRQARWGVVLRPDWDARQARFEALRDREAERQARDDEKR